MGYQLIETVTLTSTAGSIGFTSIPQDGISLVVLFSGRNTGATRDTYVHFNGTSDSAKIRLLGDGSTASSSTVNVVFGIPYSTYTANTFGNAQIYIANYTSATAKSVSIDAVSENNATSAEWATIVALTTTTTSPITQLSVGHNGSLAIGTTISLYKITAD
jgi:hypothetical protein